MKHSKVCWTFEQHIHTCTIQRHQLVWSASLDGGREICMTRRDEEEMQTPYRKAPGVRNWIGNLSAVRCPPEHRCVLQQRINNSYYNYWQHDRVHHLLWGGIALQHVLFLQTKNTHKHEQNSKIESFCLLSGFYQPHAEHGLHATALRAGTALNPIIFQNKPQCLAA